MINNGLTELYNDYLGHANKVDQEAPVNLKNVDMNGFVKIDPEIIMHELQNVQNSTDENLYKFIGLSYQSLIDIEFINQGAHRIQLANVFKNFRFVSAFCNVLSSVKLTPIQKIGCNKLIYDYFTMENGKDNNIVNVLYNLGYNINSECIAKLSGRGISREIMIYLAVSRYSTTDSILATKRVNLIIMNQPLSIMTEQVIIDIYSALFNDSLTSLFLGIMFDNDESEMDYESEEIYGNITLAILDIIAELPIEMIVHLIKSFTQSKMYCHINDTARFDIHSISQDYSRILYAIQCVEMEGIKVPHL